MWQTVKVLIFFLLYLFSVSNTDSEDSLAEHLEAEEHILCRKCGREVGDPSYIKRVLSPLALLHHNQTIFGQKGVPVQLFQNPEEDLFELITVEKAGCVGTGKWYRQHTWFPGYSWKICICPACGKHLGWMFEPHGAATASLNKPTAKGFYALIIENVINENFAESLMIVPKAYRS